jgi:hypothetical protein
MAFPWPMPVRSASLNLSGSVTVRIPSYSTEKIRIELLERRKSLKSFGTSEMLCSLKRSHSSWGENPPLSSK